MPDGFPNKPKILRGAFVEHGLSMPPLLVAFQFNPVQLTRNRSLTYKVPRGLKSSLREFHKWFDDLDDVQKWQSVDVQEETIGFEIRLDATDKLDEGDLVAGQFGIAPQLATLELMVHPKDEGLIMKGANRRLGDVAKGPLRKLEGFSFTKNPNPPLVLFIWGRKRVLPVNINSLNITELLYNPELYPIRATATVSLTVIEGRSPPYLYSKAMQEEISALNLASVAEITNVVIPR